MEAPPRGPLERIVGHRATYSLSTYSHLSSYLAAMDAIATFASRIRELRRSRGISQEELAHASGLHRTYIGGVERGERNITLLNAERIAVALGVSLSSCLRPDDVSEK